VKSYDIIIVGAGPAGATLGYELGRRGLSALILEKDKLPRYKACAGGVTVRAAKLLDFDIEAVVERIAYGARVTYNLRDECVKRYKRPFSYMVMRNDFDQLLVRKAREAGAIVMDGVPAIQLGMSPAGVRVVTPEGSFASRIVAGADGAEGMVAKKSGLMQGVAFDLGLEAEVAVTGDELARWDSFIGVDLGQIPGGYGWVFPKKDHLSVGVAGPTHQSKRLKPYLERLLQHVGKDQTVEFSGHLLPLRKRNMAIQRGNILLLGDAAGLIHPLTGEGIYYAIRSAQLAAPVIAGALRSDSIDLRGYQRAVDSQLMPGIELGRVLLSIFTRSPRLYFNMTRRSDLFWRCACRMLVGTRVVGA
jgi:geranylgeranyl reductase family protein